MVGLLSRGGMGEVWRALKATGCGVLRDGVYVLPKEAPTASGFAEVEEQVRAAGGFARDPSRVSPAKIRPKAVWVFC